MNFMTFIAQQLREYMAKLGVRTVDEMVGRTDLLKKKDGLTGRKATIDLSRILYEGAQAERKVSVFDPACAYDFKLEKTKDESVLLKKKEVKAAMKINYFEDHALITEQAERFKAE